MNRYEVIIFWNESDKVFIAEIPELNGCVAHGASQDEALHNVNLLVTDWLTLAKEKGWAIPTPKGRLVFA